MNSTSFRQIKIIIAEATPFHFLGKHGRPFESREGEGDIGNAREAPARLSQASERESKDPSRLSQASVLAEEVGGGRFF